MKDRQVRLWDKKEKRMIYGDDENYCITLLGSILYLHGDYYTFVNSKDFVRMDFTGHRDKKDKKIWEGDICKDYMGHLHKVIWPERYASFMFERADGRLLSGVGQSSEGLRMEVIGNIHENPTLFSI